jgi:hypothetical protein
MKITNWRRKLAAALAAGGLMSPAAVSAANLDTNIVVNPGFENTSASTCCYGAAQFLSWDAGTQRGFAYTYSQGYDEGGPLAGGGTYYFSGNAEGDPNGAFPIAEVQAPGQVSQDIDVSAGPSGALIASGEAAIRLSAFMTSYLNDFDVGNVQVDFLTAGNVNLGSAKIRDLDSGHKNVWNQTTGRSGVPVGTAKLRVSVFADQRTFGPDGYIDNVDVQVTSGLDEVAYLEVNTTTGNMSIKNQSGAPIRTDYYQITSASGAINLAGWNSLQEQNVAGFPPGNGSGNGWEQAGAASANVIGESYLTGRSTLANNGTPLNLGNAFNTAGAHDLVFSYSAAPPQDFSPVADFDNDSDVDGKDFLTWQSGFGITTDATIAQGDADLTDALDVDEADYGHWAEEFGGTNFPNVLTVGSVRYVTGAAVGVPEPGSVLLAGLGFAALSLARSRRT